MNLAKPKLILPYFFVAIVVGLTVAFAYVAYVRRQEHKQNMLLYKSFNPSRLPVEYGTLFNESFNKYMNKKLDPEPILFFAYVSRTGGDPYPSIMLHLSDEDRDLEGVGVTEAHLLSNGRTITIEEKYPIYHHHKLPAVTWPFVRINIRDPIDSCPT